MSAWGVPPAGSAWATQVDEEEAANGGQLDAPKPAEAPTKFVARGAAERALGSEAAFPSLGESLSIKESKADKRKKELKAARTKMTLAEFQSGAAPGGSSGAFRPSRVVGGGGGASSGGLLGDDVLARLPTAPRARTEGEDAGGPLGGAFRDYGGDRGGGRDERDRGGRYGDRDDRRGGFGGSDDDDGFGPSRADASDNWGGEKKFVPSGAPGGAFGGYRRDDRGSGGGLAERYGPDRSAGGFGDRPPRDVEPSGLAERYGPDRSIPSDDFGPARADMVDKWERKGLPPPPPGGDERAGAGSGPPGPSAADTEDRWSKRFVPSAPGSSAAASEDGGGGGGPAVGRSDDAANWRRAADASGSDAGGADRGPSSAGGSRPRLALKPRTLPLPGDGGSGRTTPAPPSAGPSSEKGSEGGGGAANPFGAARPREDVLREQGRDAAAEDAKRAAAAEKAARGRPPRPGPAEKALRSKIEALKKRVEAGEGDAPAEVAAATAAAAAAAADGGEEGKAGDDDDAAAGPATPGKTVAAELAEAEAELAALVKKMEGASLRRAGSGGGGGRDRDRDRGGDRRSKDGREGKEAKAPKAGGDAPGGAEGEPAAAAAAPASAKGGDRW